MDKQTALDIIYQYVDIKDYEKIEAKFNEIESDETDDYESECEDKEAAMFEEAAHGYDFDDDHCVNPYTGESVYDFDPGVRYNDGGEPIGYM